MSNLTLTKTRLLEGVWEGRLTYDGKNAPEPDIEVTHREQPIPDVEVVKGDAGGS